MNAYDLPAYLQTPIIAAINRGLFALCANREHLEQDGSLEKLRRSWAGSLPRGIDLLAAACSSSPQPAQDAPSAILEGADDSPLAALEVRLIHPACPVWPVSNAHDLLYSCEDWCVSLIQMSACREERNCM